MKRLFGERATRRVPVSSTKSMTGICLAGAGRLEAGISVAGGLCATTDLPPDDQPIHADPKCDLAYVPNVARKASVITRFNSFWLGGHQCRADF